MSKKKIKLTLPPVQYSLIAISCFETLHKFVWLVNSHLGLQLRESGALRIKTIRMAHQEDVEFIEFPSYRDEASHPELTFVMVKNRVEQHWFFKELQNIDFLFIIKGEAHAYESKGLLQNLKAIPGVMAAITVDLSKSGSLELLHQL